MLLYSYIFYMSENITYNKIKRVTDIIVSWCCIVPVSMVTATSILLVFMIDRHSPIFKQSRTIDGFHFFDIWKIKTMKKWKPTALWSFLRKFSIDELPQFYNILKWEMSLIWPRPTTQDNFILSWYKPSVSKPWLTWILQIQDKHKELDVHRINIYNRYYDIKKSVLLDIWIVLKTVPYVIAGKNVDSKHNDK